MARRVFFSFHYESDVWRVNQVRHSWVTRGNQTAAGYIDAAEFESIKRTGEAAVKRWIDRQLYGTSVTVVLIGEETADRKYVQYEIRQSIEKGNGIVPIHIHSLCDQFRQRGRRGYNPLRDFYIDGVSAYSIYPVYDWVADDGFNNLENWVERAAYIAEGV